MSVSRRHVLQYAGAGILGVAALGVPLNTLQAKSASRLAAANMPKPFQSQLKIPPVLAPERTVLDSAGRRLSYYRIRQTPGLASILPHFTTPVLGYNGIIPGPTISVEQGTKISLRMDNLLPLVHPQYGHVLNTSTHLHGSASLPQFDGYASDLTPKGLCKDYE
ncbi:Multicopper oxidase [Arthrobacter subterraneus]|uniref:Multicopper oxidase n=2 Tax=Arthrobacter TaxID=1663 RepID=A0A1G8PBH4_9MICC|nr:multicopper oxidase domain-containing protein [Arthrobacter subterraneus]SDI89090.1 Multicopper oxidase [Arthrobacter subterraneus]